MARMGGVRQVHKGEEMATSFRPWFAAAEGRWQALRYSRLGARVVAAPLMRKRKAPCACCAACRWWMTRSAAGGQRRPRRAMSRTST